MSNSAITGPIFTDVRRSPSGSAAAPSWSFADATGTGVYLASTDVLALSTAGVQRVVVDASGNVGIGTASPNGALGIARAAGVSAFVEIAGNGNTPGAASLFVGQDSASTGYVWNRANSPLTFGTNSAERMRIDTDGNVGIGITPRAKFHLNQTDSILIDARSPTAIISDGFNDGSGGLTIGSFKPIIQMIDYSGSAGHFTQEVEGTSYIIKGGSTADTSYAGVTERIRIDGSGSLVFPNSTSVRPGSTGQYIITAASGGLYQQAGSNYYLVSTAGGATSDETLKKNIQPIQDALAKVCAISGITYEFIDEPMCDADKGQQIGVGAQTVEAQFPEVVITQEDGKKAVRYDRLVAPLFEAIKELKAELDEAKAKIAALEAK